MEMQDPLFSKRVALALHAEWWDNNPPQPPDSAPLAEYVHWSDSKRERKAVFRDAVNKARRFEDLPPEHRRTLLAIEASENRPEASETRSPSPVVKEEHQ